MIPLDNSIKYGI